MLNNKVKQVQNPAVHSAETRDSPCSFCYSSVPHWLTDTTPGT